jgi:hypothetical protein
LLGLPTSASAGTILSFGQVSNLDFLSYSASSATLTTHTVSTPLSTTSIPISVTSLLTIPISPTPAWETFVAPGLTSSTPQVGDEKGGFSGTIEITSAPDGAGVNILTATFSGIGILNASGGSGVLRIPDGATYTSNEPDIVAAFGGAPGSTVTIPGGNLALTLVNVSPLQSGTFADFTAQSVGNFATVIPEPASIVMMGLGLLGVLGYGSLRHKSSKA